VRAGGRLPRPHRASRVVRSQSRCPPVARRLARSDCRRRGGRGLRGDAGPPPRGTDRRGGRSWQARPLREADGDDRGGMRSDDRRLPRARCASRHRLLPSLLPGRRGAASAGVAGRPLAARRATETRASCEVPPCVSAAFPAAMRRAARSAVSLCLCGYVKEMRAGRAPAYWKARRRSAIATGASAGRSLVEASTLMRRS
jgi:hypothetical protein